MKLSTGIARRLLLGTLLGLCSATALPQSPALYTVEIVVFRNGELSTLPEANPPTVTEDAIELTLVPTGKLNSAATRLRARTSGFKVLAQVAWTQAPTTRNSHIGASATQLGLGNGIAGKVFLERSQNLFFGVDLTIEEGGHRYRINQIRSVKRNEIYYFDHPAVGVLAILTPVTG